MSGVSWSSFVLDVDVNIKSTCNWVVLGSNLFCLGSEVDEEVEKVEHRAFYQRNDKTTVLHMSIMEFNLQKPIKMLFNYNNVIGDFSNIFH